MSDTEKRLVIDVLQDARRQLDMSSSKETAEKLAEAIKALDAAVDEAMARDCMSDAAMVARKVGDMRANPADEPPRCNHPWDTNADSGHEDQWPHTCGRHAGHAGVHECSRCEQTNVPTPGVPDRPWNGDRYVPEMVARDSIPGFMPGMGDIKAPTPPPECGITWASAMLDGTRHGHTCGLPSGHEGKHRCRGCPVHVDVVAPPPAPLRMLNLERAAQEAIDGIVAGRPAPSMVFGDQMQLCGKSHTPALGHTCILPIHNSGSHECVCGEGWYDKPAVAAAPPSLPTQCTSQWQSPSGHSCRCNFHSSVGAPHLCRCVCGNSIATPVQAATPEPALQANDPRIERLQQMAAEEKARVQHAREQRIIMPMAPALPTWRPIETAPRDGDKVFLLLRTGDAHCGWYNSAAEAWGNRERMWRNDAITHWCPLPVMP